MTRTWMAMLVLAGGSISSVFGQQYPQQYPPTQGYGSGNEQDPYNQYGSGQYAGDPGYPYAQGDPAYDNMQGDYAPAPPPVPSYAYQRPPMPGPGYYWVDGYWNFMGGRYSWVGGYWTIPPYAGTYWVAPRYSSGRFYRGFWGGARRGFDRGFVRGGYGNRGYVQPYRQSYRAPAPRGSGFGGSRYRDSRPANQGLRQGRR